MQNYKTVIDALYTAYKNMQTEYKYHMKYINTVYAIYKYIKKIYATYENM